MGRKLTIKDFVDRGNTIHEGKYDYGKVKYINTKSKVEIICPEHGVFEQTPEKHLNRGRGCPVCGGTEQITTDSFITRAKEIHNDVYDYSQVIYKKAKVKIKIICPEHGIFKQTPSSHIHQKTGCPKCSKKHQYSTKEFVTKSMEMHGDRYDYGKVEYKNNYTYVTIICDKHGEFKQTPSNHLRGKGCSICGNSHSETIISQYLNKHGIDYSHQHKFDDCKHLRRLPFDFYLPEYNTCIEFNGKQHYHIVEFFGGTKGFKQQQKRDKIKKEFCKEMGIDLIVIRYDEDIVKVLKSVL